MVQPLEAGAVGVVLSAERPLVEHVFGPLINHRLAVAAERRAVLLVLEEILPHLRPHVFQQEAQMGRDWVVAQHGVPRLQQVPRAQGGKAAEHDKARQPPERRLQCAAKGEQKRSHGCDGQADVASREGQHPGLHRDVLPHLR
ncbi:MAG: hypothetical protein ACJ8AW_49905 [Rhodopila sp.]